MVSKVKPIKLMKKIVLIFISVTIISSIFYYFIGQGIIDLASEGEIDRGAGRTNGVFGKIEGEINKAISSAKEYGEYIQMEIRLREKYGEVDDSIFNLENKIKKTQVGNILLLEEDFTIKQALKIKNIDVNDINIKNVLNNAKEIIKEEKNQKKGFGGDIIISSDMPYIVGVKRITDINDKKTLYLAVLIPMNNEYIEELSELSDRKISIIKKEEANLDNGKVEKNQLYNRDSYFVTTDTSIDVYTELKKGEEGENYYLLLRDERVVRNSATRNINTLIIVIIILTIIANILVYQLINRNVLKRIIKINKVVNEVTEGQDLEVKLEDEIKGDEISILTEDLNKMFTRLKEYSDNLEFLSSHDMLTSLMNRHKLMQNIEKLKVDKEEFALLFIDLDNFKGINDTLGHKIGDGILCKVANELLEFSINNNVEVARIGGDEFIILRKGKNDKDEVNKFAEEILNKINKVYEVYNYSYEIKASIGISFYPQHSDEQVTLLQYSDIAMYISKDNGGNKYTIFEKEMLKPLEIESRLKGAIERKEFKVYYQPIYGVNGNQIIGAEALTRWEAEEGMIFPDKFIPVSKKTGDIVEIDKLVLRDAIATCREWIDKGKKDFYISMNASKQFLKQKGFVDFIKSELEAKNVPSSALKLEITEDEIIDDVEYTIELLDKIRKIGVKVSLDDFGVGYSSFSHIQILPVDVIKIDRSLVMNIEDDIKSRSIVETMISLCHSLNLKVVCEGVEDIEQVEILKALKCDSIQGYYFSKPLCKEKFTEYVETF